MSFAGFGLDATGAFFDDLGGVFDFFTTGATDFLSNFRFESSRLGAACFRAARGFLDFAVVRGGRGVVDFFLIAVDDIFETRFLFKVMFFFFAMADLPIKVERGTISPKTFALAAKFPF